MKRKLSEIQLEIEAETNKQPKIETQAQGQPEFASMVFAVRDQQANEVIA